MQPASQIQAVIECLGTLLDAWHGGQRLPADVNFQKYTKTRRFIGSKDRQALAKRYYHVLRHFAILDELASKLPGHQHALPYPPVTKNGEATAHALVIADLVSSHELDVDGIAKSFDGETYHPPILLDSEWKWVHGLADRFAEGPIDTKTDFWVKQNTAPWLADALQESMGENTLKELHALQCEAPVDIRANTLKTSRDSLQQALKQDGIETMRTTISPVGLRLARRAAVFATDSFREGHFEMQDEGSQVAAYLVDAQPGMRVVDFCAGAGGKTLAIAAQMNNKGRILAFDVSAKRLKELPVRIRRSGVDNAQSKIIESESDTILKRHKRTADRVLVDAPCSGTGTWRRNPDLKWRLTPEDIAELTVKQLAILNSAGRLVKPGGRLIYVTCSLLKKENEDVITDFLGTNEQFKVVCAQKIWNKETVNDSDQTPPSYLSLSPGVDGTDGFFAAVLERIA